MAHRKTARNPLFAGRWFEDEIILLCLRWSFRFKFSYRDLAEILSERGLVIAHSTILRWVVHYAEVCEKRWRRFERPVGGSWRADETFIKVRGQLMYLYGSVAKQLGRFFKRVVDRASKKISRPCRIVRFSRSTKDVFSFEESSESRRVSSNRHAADHCSSLDLDDAIVPTGLDHLAVQTRCSNSPLRWRSQVPLQNYEYFALNAVTSLLVSHIEFTLM
jgi:hypothetical protein